MGRMKRFAFLALLAAACATPHNQGEVTKNRADYRTHPEYDDFRPIAIAVMPVKTTVFATQMDTRADLYEGLFKRKYSPFKLDVVDAHTDSKGKFEGHDLAWDATLEVRITRLRPGRAANTHDCDAEAALRYRTGEELWTCKLSDYVVAVPFTNGELDFRPACREIAEAFLSRLPPRPPVAKG